MMIESASSGGGSGSGGLTGLQLHQEEETGDEVRELQDPAAATTATTEGSEATARATNHDGPARGDP